MLDGHTELSENAVPGGIKWLHNTENILKRGQALHFSWYQKLKGLNRDTFWGWEKGGYSSSQLTGSKCYDLSDITN